MSSAGAAQADMQAQRQYYDSGAGASGAGYQSGSQGTATTNSTTTHSYDPYAEPAIGGRSSRRPDCARKLVVVGDGGEAGNGVFMVYG